MNSLKTIDKRHLVPRWKSIQDASDSGELFYYKEDDSENAYYAELYDEMVKAQIEWTKEKSLFTAIEYLEKQRVVGVDLNLDAVQFVKKIIDENDDIPFEIKNFFNETERFNSKDIEPQTSISTIRKKLFLHSDDAYLWLELARNYLTLGQPEKSEKYLTVARSLAPNDRYIARSMMRFYHHTEEIDKALYYVRKMENLSRDPMLLSGEIALSNVMGTVSKNIKRAKTMVDSQSYSPLSISELKSEIATMEIMSGKERIGKRLLSQSLNGLTENSYAQVTWINHNVIRLPWMEELSNNKIQNNYEGEIYLNFASSKSNVNWKYLYEQCKSWNNYQPFSCAPVYLGGVIAADFIEDYQGAFKFALNALNCHRNDTGLLNNIAYSAILNSDSNTARDFLNIQQSKINSDEDKILYLATKGLFEFRFGDPLCGKIYYQNSYELAKQIGSKSYAQVLAYLYRELSRTGDVVEMEFVRNEILKCKDVINNFMFNNLLKKFNII